MSRDANSRGAARDVRGGSRSAACARFTKFSAPAETLAGLTARFGRRILGDDLFECAPSARIVAELGQAARDVEHRVGHFLTVRIGSDELPLRRDRAAEILERVLRVPRPVQRRGCERTLRVGACEGLEARNRGGVAAVLELI